jgi:23S rRNA pseudouridine1911/1915/1917 synthase
MTPVRHGSDADDAGQGQGEPGAREATGGDEAFAAEELDAFEPGGEIPGELTGDASGTGAGTSVTIGGVPWWPPPGAEADGADWGLRSHLDETGKPRIVERHLLVTPELAGLRLDHFIKAQIPRLSRTKVQHVVVHQLRRAKASDAEDARAARSARAERSAGPRDDDHDHAAAEPAPRPLRPNTSVLAGERYTISRPARPEPPCPRTFGIVFEDDELMVIDKPAGLPVHASAKFYFNTLTRVMMERFPGADLQICHRLDRETSGILVVAKSKARSAVVKAAFAQKRVSKTYLAVVHGDPPWPELDDDAPDGRLDAAIRVAGVNDPTPLTGVRMLAGPGGLPSLTLVRVVERRPPYALVRCQPVSGRQHQIRLHLADAGYPIVGDKLYGHGDAVFMAFCDRGITEELARRFVLPRHALHAASIKVPHPRDGRMLELSAPLPRDLQQLLSRPRDS